MIYFDDFNALHYKKQGDKNDYLIQKINGLYDLSIHRYCLNEKPMPLYDGMPFIDDTPDFFYNRTQAVRYIKTHDLI